MSEFKNVILHGDAIECLRQLPDNYVHTVVTSPPYWGLRDYGVDGQIGLEKTPEEYVEKLVKVFREVKRVLRNDGTLWLNLGDSYAGSGKGYGGKDHGKLGKHANDFLPKPTKTPYGLKPKDLVGIPWRVAFALQADGWYLRSDIIWQKPNALPESVKDRPTKAHEYIFLLSKSPRYYYDVDAIREPVKPESLERYKYGLNTQHSGFARDARTGSSFEKMRQGAKMGDFMNPKGRNKRSVWTIPTRPFKGAHFAVFPPDLIEPCILAGCPDDGIVLDPFFGAGTTGLVARKHNRNFIGIELNRDYVEMAKKRIESEYEGFRINIVESEAVLA